MESAKLRHYELLSTRLGIHFVPLVFKSYGTIGPKGNHFLKTLARLVVSNQSPSGNADPVLSALLLHNWRRRLSCALKRANARILQMRSYRGAAAHCRTHTPNAPDFADLRIQRLSY